jgi:hypothetical protein
MIKTGRSAKQIVIAFDCHINKHKRPKNLFDPKLKYFLADFNGNSFMLNPLDLLDNARSWRPIEVAQYIALASYRNYANYEVNKIVTLDVLHSPISVSKIENNRLLKIVDDKIHFYYEEVPLRRNKIWR